MLELLTVSLQCRCEMFEDLKQFVSKKEPHCVELSLNDVSAEHQFTMNKEEVSLVLTSPIYQSQNRICLRYKNISEGVNYANTQILALKFYGCNIGLKIFDSVYTRWHDAKDYPGFLYMGYPGEWVFNFKSPVAKNFGGICFG